MRLEIVCPFCSVRASVVALATTVDSRIEVRGVFEFCRIPGDRIMAIPIYGGAVAGKIVRPLAKGQITIPKPVREALKLSEGDRVVFRVIEGERAILARTPDLLELAGTVPVPAGVRGIPWDEIRRRAWAAQLRG